MKKIDILASWNSCKTLIKQAKEFANSGYKSNRTKEERLSSAFQIENKSEPQQNNISPATVPNEILTSLKNEFKNIIEFIEIFLMQDPAGIFYGMILCEVESEIDFTQQGLIDVNVQDRPFKFKYNPLWGEDYSINELIGSTVNEILKVVYLHPSTYAKINFDNDLKKHDDLEIGSSVSSSELVLKDIVMSKTKNRLKLHDSVYRLSDLEEETNIDRNLKRIESLEYYYKVSEKFRKNNKNNSSNSGSGVSSGVSTPENKESQGKPIHNWEKAKNANRLEDDMKNVIKSAYDNLSSEQRGTLPSSMTAFIEQLFKAPELNWKDILKRYIGTIPSGHRPSKLRLNRRQPFRFDLSGKLSNTVVRLVIAIDTSGSMSDKDIAYCMNEIYNIIKDYKTEITVIECDAAIGRVYTVKSPKDIKPDVTGRGGTEFSPVIEYINDHKFRDAVMIYFTDGYGESKIERPRTYRNLWVIRGREPYISVEEPYGEVKCLSGDEDYTSLYK